MDNGNGGGGGTPGADGQTPYIGENGNWFIGDTDTGVNAGGSGGGSADEIVRSDDIGNGVAYHLMRKDGAGAIASPYGYSGTLEVWSSGKMTLSFTYEILSDNPEGVWKLGDMDVEDISKFLDGSDEGALFRNVAPMLDRIAISEIHSEPQGYDPLIFTANLNRPSSDFIPPYMEETELGWEGDFIKVTYFGYVDASLFDNDY